MDLTPGPEVYEAAARAGIAAGDSMAAKKLVDDLVPRWVKDPWLRGVVESAYRAGREDEARDIDRYPPAQILACGLDRYCGQASCGGRTGAECFAFRHNIRANRARVAAFREIAVSIRDQVSFPYGPGGDPGDWVDVIAGFIERRADEFDGWIRAATGVGADQPRTPLEAETTDTESSPEVERADG